MRCRSGKAEMYNLIFQKEKTPVLPGVGYDESFNTPFPGLHRRFHAMVTHAC